MRNFITRLWITALLWFVRITKPSPKPDFKNHPCRSGIVISQTTSPRLLDMVRIHRISSKEVTLCGKKTANELLAYAELLLNYIYRQDSIPASVISDYHMSREEISIKEFLSDVASLSKLNADLNALLAKTERMINASSDGIQYHYWIRMIAIHQDCLLLITFLNDVSLRREMYE